jgi:hypothetical protein
VRIVPARGEDGPGFCFFRWLMSIAITLSADSTDSALGERCTWLCTIMGADGRLGDLISESERFFGAIYVGGKIIGRIMFVLVSSTRTRPQPQLAISLRLTAFRKLFLLYVNRSSFWVGIRATDPASSFSIIHADVQAAC